ncbi:MAG: ParA family protein [Thalassobaculum sp.]|uniref:ParA family protein n=1 Tax=Thalassobaculum sp. TaxID=2022740 RepID=UPI0032EE9FA6
MAQVISALQQKGGVGKSTLVCGIAYLLGRQGAKVLIVDADRQGTCVAYHDTAEKQPFNITAVTDEAGLRNVLATYGPDHDLVLIDTPGIESQLTAHVAASSDLVLIPSTPSQPDAIGASRTWSLVERVRAANGGRPRDVQIILTKFHHKARITARITEAFLGHGMPLYTHGLQELTGFKEMYSTGVPTGAAAGALQFLVAQMQRDGVITWSRAPESCQ